jgi:hypothetical protein
MLTAFGFGVWHGTPDEDLDAAFDEARRQLLQDAPQFESACEWIERRLQPRQTINGAYDSYALKHVAEREIGYLTNGTFIAAMAACGYELQPAGANALFNVCSQSVEQARGY